MGIKGMEIATIVLNSLILCLGLHGLLKSIQKPCNLKKFDGQTLGVDAYGWLHRGTVACAMDLALDKPTAKSVTSLHAVCIYACNS